MIIQMDGSGIGNYSMVNVLTAGTTTGPTASLSVEPYLLSPYFNVWPTLSFGTNDRVQVVKISRFWDLTVTAGRITCPAYDVNSGTGGILAVMVGNDFAMSGGYFDVHAKGFYPHFPTGGLGAGGTGAAGRTTHFPGGATQGSHSASVDVNQQSAYSTAYTPNSGSDGMYGETDGALHYVGTGTPTKQFYTSHNGQNGGTANNTGSPGSATTGEVNYNSVGTSSYPGSLILGGSGVAGTNGGAGGGGGGKGGTGGGTNNTRPTSGSPVAGSNGNAGFTGGGAGAGGAGGGILIIKVANSDLSGLSSASKHFIASGSQGANGSNAGDGGMGGEGGLGAEGGCNGDFVTPGGIGGTGDGGVGGNGGDAGSGGKGGPVWIIKKNGGTHSTFNSHVNNLGGKGGRGGAPGYTATHVNTRRPRNYENPGLSGLGCLNGEFDHAPGKTQCPSIVCDCDAVFDYLGTSLNGTVAFSGAGANWQISKGGLDVHWDKTNYVLYYESTVSGCTTRYECRMKWQTTYLEFMDKVFGEADLETYSAGGSPGIDAVSMSGSKTRLLAPGGHIMMEYDPALDRLYDLDNLTQPYVDVDVCSYDYSVQSGGGGGGGGQVPDDEVLIKREPTGNYGADAGGTPVNGDQEETSSDGPIPPDQENDVLSDIKTSLRPNEIEVINHQGILVNYELYTITGQKAGAYSSKETFIIPISASGIYILKMQSEKGSTTRKLYIP
jgi:hypothetical protein